MLDLLNHTGNISRVGEDFHTEGYRRGSVYRDRLVDRKDIRTVIRNDVEQVRQKPRLVHHLGHKCHCLSSRVVGKRKNIILIFIEGTAA